MTTLAMTAITTLMTMQDVKDASYYEILKRLSVGQERATVFGFPVYLTDNVPENEIWIVAPDGTLHRVVNICK